MKETLTNNIKTFIKFIIPCYNVGDTIGRMLDSILSQTFTDYHIVCVEDCSIDNTWEVLQKYRELNPDKMTLIKNQNNLGAGESRNVGVNHTRNTLPSEFLWIVDGDDYLADNSVLQRIYDFARKNPQLDLINLGWNNKGRPSVAKIGSPNGLCGRVISPEIYVQALHDNITGDDVYPHFVMFDNVDDSRIGTLNYICYVYPKMGFHTNNMSKKLNNAKIIGLALMKHKFRKQYVVDALYRAWIMGKIRKEIPDFKVVVESDSQPDGGIQDCPRTASV